MVSTNPKNFYAILFQKLVSWFLYILNFYKKSKEIKKSWFLVNSRCFCFAFDANLMLKGKKEKT